MSDSNIEYVATATAGTAEWLQASRDVTLGAYVPGDLVAVPAPRAPERVITAQDPNEADSASGSS